MVLTIDFIAPIKHHWEMPKRTYQPSKRRRARRFGFLIRKKKHQGVLARRRKRGRARLAVKTS